MIPCYDTILQLQTAMSRNIEERRSVLPATIHPERNIITHLCFDNFDLRKETPSGEGNRHSSHGIIIHAATSQEDEPPVQCSSTGQRTGERAVKSQHVKLDSCFAKSHAEPNLVVTVDLL